MAVRVAREIHVPISAALSLSMNELMIWREIFTQEYYELHPEKRPQTEQENIETIKNMLERKSAAARNKRR